MGQADRGTCPGGPNSLLKWKVPDPPKHVTTRDSRCLSSGQAGLKGPQMLRKAGRVVAAGRLPAGEVASSAGTGEVAVCPFI